MKLIGTISLTLALAACLTGASAEEETADYLYSRAVQLSMNGSYLDALESLNKALDLDTSNITFLNMKGELLAFGLGQPEEGLDSFERAIILDNASYDAWFNKGLVLASAGRYDDAIVCLDRAAWLNTSSYDAWSNLGMALANAERLVDAAACFERAVNINPNDPRGYNNLGVVMLAQDEPADAMAYFKTALDKDPYYGVAYRNMGIALESMGRSDEAEVAFSQARQLGAI
jgi:tetratricopeptide (TPR) repeat protein